MKSGGDPSTLWLVVLKSIQQLNKTKYCSHHPRFSLPPITDDQFPFRFKYSRGFN
jgi:hypothetical protein